MDWGRARLVDFNAGKTQLVFFDRFNDMSALEEIIYGVDFLF